MKIMRNLILTILTIILLAFTSTVIAAETEPATGSQTPHPSLFNDVSPSDPDTLYINYLAHKEIMKGYPDGGFHPRESLTRAQAAVVIAKAMNLDSNQNQSSNFKDVASDHWALPYINSATSAGYLKGYPDGSYHPDRELSRAEGISLVLRISKQETQNSTLPQLKDVAPNHWAAAPIATALEAGMIGLTEDNTCFLPDSPFSRGSLARALSILLTRDPELYQTELIGTLKSVAGQITLTREGQNRTIKQEIILQPGDIIKSSSRSSAEINYPDGSAVLIKENTEISIKESWGRATIKKNGTPGAAVDWLNLDLKQGTIFSALATRHQNQLETQNVSQKAKLLATLGLISLDDKAKIPWYQAADQKKVKMKVDMPWGAAAVRGTFISITVEPGGKSEVSCLTGDAEVSSNIPNNQLPATVVLQGGQSSILAKENAAPEPPAPLNDQQKQQFIQEKTWVETTAQNMDKNQEAINSPAPVVVENLVTTAPVQTVPQQHEITQAQQALSTLEIVQEALEEENQTPIPTTNPVEETPSSSSLEKSLGQTVTLTANHPVNFSGGIKLDLGSMTIPAGASVKVTEVPSTDLISDTGLSVAGKIIDIDFENLSITEPVELTLPLASGADPAKAAIYYYNNGTWEYQPTWLENGVLKTLLTHCSIYAVLIDQTPPAGVQISKGSSSTSSVELILSASDSGGVAQYQIYRDGGLLTTTTASTYTDTGLENGRSYTYKMKAIDRFGNISGFSSELILACTPQPSAQIQDIEISEISVTPQVLAIGATSQVNVITSPSGVSLSFTSSNTSIASVDQLTGLVSGISSGIATITVTASKDGYNSSSRNISVTIYAPGTSDARLSSLSISTGSLSPVFSPVTTSYSASVDYEVSSIIVRAAAADPHASIAVNSGQQSTGSISAVISLYEGSNSITVRVVAENDINSRDYTINVSRATAPVTPPSPPVQNIEISQMTANPQAIACAATSQINVSTTPSGTSLSFASSNSSIAVVNQLTGLVTGVSPGIATITVTASKDGYNSASRTISITVYDAGASGGDVTLRISPASYPAGSLNEIIPVEIKVDDAINLYALEMHISFDPQALTVVSQSGQEVASVQAGDIFAFLDNYPVQNYVDQAGGKINFAISCLGQAEGQSGSCTVCRFYVKTKSETDSTLVIYKNILMARQGGSIVQISPSIGNCQINF